jgi:hypothetical protein
VGRCDPLILYPTRLALRHCSMLPGNPLLKLFEHELPPEFVPVRMMPLTKPRHIKRPFVIGMMHFGGRIATHGTRTINKSAARFPLPCECPSGDAEACLIVGVVSPPLSHVLGVAALAPNATRRELAAAFAGACAHPAALTDSSSSMPHRWAGAVKRRFFNSLVTMR